MERFLAGTDKTIVIPVRDYDGAAYNLTDKDVSLYLINARGKHLLDIAISGEGEIKNIISATYLGNDQVTLGAHDIELIINANEKRAIRRKWDNAFALVDRSADALYYGERTEIREIAEGEAALQLTCDLDIYTIAPIIPKVVVGADGLDYWSIDGIATTYRATGRNAYELAVERGFVGTLDDYLQYLRQPALDAAAQANEDVNGFLTSARATILADLEAMQTGADQKLNEIDETLSNNLETYKTETTTAIESLKSDLETQVSDAIDTIENTAVTDVIVNGQSVKSGNVASFEVQEKITSTNKLDYSLLENVPAQVDISGKQDKLTQTQLNAVNSGITREKVIDICEVMYIKQTDVYDDEGYVIGYTYSDAAGYADRNRVLWTLFKEESSYSHMHIEIQDAEGYARKVFVNNTTGSNKFICDNGDNYDELIIDAVYPEDDGENIIGWDIVITNKVITGSGGGADLSALENRVDALEGDITNLQADKQDTISDLATIRNNATNGQTAYGWGNHASQGYLKQDSLDNYATKGELDGKQDAITDLDTIRQGAALGATALQEHQDISGKEDKSNKVTSLTYTNATNEKYPSAKAVYDKIGELQTVISGKAIDVVVVNGNEMGEASVSAILYEKQRKIFGSVTSLEVTIHEIMEEVVNPLEFNFSFKADTGFTGLTIIDYNAGIYWGNGIPTIEEGKVYDVSILYDGSYMLGLWQVYDTFQEPTTIE